jgi:hypothetical protein
MKEPHKAISQNLHPSQWRREKAPVHLDPGGALSQSVPTSEKASLLEDGKPAASVQTACVESVRLVMAPIAAGQVLPQNDVPAKEDGK